jgi:hypothetical protein
MSNQLQHKLFNYEAPPPEGAWNNIAASLDENVSLILSEKLYQYEETPSSIVWQNISSQLDNSVSEQAKVVPFYIQYRRPLKYSGAVAIFIFLAVVTSLFISKKTESEVPPQGISNATTQKDTSKPLSNVSEENHPLAQLSEKNKPEYLITKSKVSIIRQEEDQTSSPSSFESFLPQQAEKNEMVSSSVSSDKYMMYSDGDGNVVRLPKKIFNAFACPTEDVMCKQKLQRLKEKFAASAMTADFTGVLQILKSLQENQ